MADVNLKSEFSRLKTYPRIWNMYYSKAKCASLGFAFDSIISNNECYLRCVFCEQIIRITQQPLSSDLLQDHRTTTSNCQFEGNIPLGDCSDYRYERNRLITFLTISWPYTIDPNDLAKNGFYWKGYEDSVRCFVCRLEITGWETDDEAAGEHVKWNPNCAFVKNIDVGNIPLNPTVNSTYIGNTDISTDCFGQHIPTGQITQVKYPKYETFESRFNTFKTWPKGMHQRPQQLSEAGFYYTGQGDRVICFCCGGGLKEWGKDDEPWQEHAQWFGYCEYLRDQKGEYFINCIKRILRARGENHAVTMSSSEPQAGTSYNGLVEKTDDQARKGTDQSLKIPSTGSQLNVLRICKVCFENELGIVFLPCGHMATCPDCAPQLDKCPICRIVATAYVRAFLP